MITVFVASVLAFLLGMAVGIAGYFFTTIAAYEKKILAIFDRMCGKYEGIISRKEEENKRIYKAYRELQKKVIEQEAEEYDV